MSVSVPPPRTSHRWALAPRPKPADTSSSTAELDRDLPALSGADSTAIYCQTKFVQLLAAHWWRRQLTGQCTVVAVSPGLIPNTGLGRQMGTSMNMTDAKPVEEGMFSSAPGCGVWVGTGLC